MAQGREITIHSGFKRLSVGGEFEPGHEGWFQIQQTGSKLGKEYVKVVYSHPAYLTYMQSTS